MNTNLVKVIGILLVFLGELFAVYAETFAVKYGFLSSGFWKMFIIITLGGFLLVSGYIIGYKAFHNLWIITVISIATLLIAEPLIIILFFHQTPTTGALIGFILGIIGLISSIFF
jgi:hypothetical protein